MKTHAVTLAVFVSVAGAGMANGHAIAAGDLRVGDARIVEGDSGTRTVQVIVSLSPPATGPVTVAYTTKDGTATAGADYQATSGTVAFAKGESTRRIPIAVIGEKAIERNETLDVILSAPAGATLADDTGQVTIVNDDLPPGGPPTYEVRFTVTGYSGEMAGNPDCPVRKNGQSTLEGLVEGSERGAAHDDLEYRGTLWFDVDMDLCGVDRITGEDFLCSISVFGNALLSTELSVYADDRGGYLKTPNVVGTPFGVMLGGPKQPCTQKYINGESVLFPLGGTSNAFNPAQLKVPSGPLRVGKYPVDADFVFEVLRKVR